jgi:antitoxin component YwqK of YwqJK toxin-antitoxin module
MIITISVFCYSCNEEEKLCDCGDLILSEQNNKWTLNHKPYTGKCISYYQDRIKESEASFINGKLQGHMLSYFPSGNLDEDSKWINGEMIDSVINYYESGELSGITSAVKIVDGKSSGYIKYYYKSGQLSEEGEVVNENKVGVWKVYHKNGEIMTIEKWKNNMQTDSSYGYYENGQLQMKGSFVNGKQEGKWIFYDSLTGNIDGYLFYENGIVKKGLKQ